jgi:hypothetical protein
VECLKWWSTCLQNAKPWVQTSGLQKKMEEAEKEWWDVRKI